LSQLNLPGNVRQLENLCNWIVVMAPGQTVEVKDLPPELLASARVRPIGSNGDGQTLSGTAQLAEVEQVAANWQDLLEKDAASLLESNHPNVMDGLVRQFESILIRSALKFTNGKKNEAAIRLGIGRNTITRKLAELDIESKE
jgi:two-component system nitrogen regulation response regulator GlnG